MRTTPPPDALTAPTAMNPASLGISVVFRSMPRPVCGAAADAPAAATTVTTTSESRAANRRTSFLLPGVAGGGAPRSWPTVPAGAGAIQDTGVVRSVHPPPGHSASAAVRPERQPVGY